MANVGGDPTFDLKLLSWRRVFAFQPRIAREMRVTTRTAARTRFLLLALQEEHLPILVPGMLLVIIMLFSMELPLQHPM